MWHWLHSFRRRLITCRWREVTKKATGTEAGESKRTCGKCGEEETEEIPALGGGTNEPGTPPSNNFTPPIPSAPPAPSAPSTEDTGPDATPDTTSGDNTVSSNNTVLSDTASGIMLSGAIPDGAQLKVVPGNTTATRVVFDITLVGLNGIAVQPDGNVTVSIPVPSGWNVEGLNVYREEAGGTYTDMKAAYQNGNMVFTTNHFSTYILTSEKLADGGQSAESGNGSENTAGSANTPNPNGNPPYRSGTAYFARSCSCSICYCLQKKKVTYHTQTGRSLCVLFSR